MFDSLLSTFKFQTPSAHVAQLNVPPREHGMFVHVEVLEGRGCLADLGVHADDHIAVRVGEPESWAGAKGMASTTIEAPVIGTPSGVALPQKLADKIKHQITKRAVHRNTDKYQLRLYVLKHDGTETKWLGIVAFKLLSFSSGFVVERWVPMKPATKTEPGELRVRIVVRDSEEDAKRVLGMPRGVVHDVSEGCCCDACDPHFMLTNPTIEYFEFNEKHNISSKAGRVISNAFVNPY